MDFSRSQGSSSRRFGGLSLVVLAHAIFIYALVTTLAHTMRNIVNQEVQVKIVDEKPLPPPPPPDLSLPPPSLTAPPPPFIPPPEVPVQQPPIVNPIAVTTSIVPPDKAFTKSVAAPPAVTPVTPTAVVPHLPPVPAFADLNACKPTYPRASLLAEEEGRVRVEFVVGANGQLVSSKILKSSGYDNLDRATINGLSRCQFRPAYRDGKPVQSSFLSDYVWRLGD